MDVHSDSPHLADPAEAWTAATNAIGRGRKWGTVYQTLKRRIMLGELAPRDVLSELALAREFACSQGVVREALLRLQEDGLVLRSGYRGTAVSRIDPEEAEEMVLLRCSIEARGVRRAVANMDAEALAGLGELVDQMEAVAASEDAYALFECDCAFHLGIFRLAGLPALEPVLSRCLLHNHRAKMATREPRRPLAVIAAAHHRVHEALAKGDAAQAVDVMTGHIRSLVEDDAAGG